MQKPKLILLVAQADDLRIGLTIPSLAWAATEKGYLFEAYLENKRDGRLFAKTGSTILGGGHFQQFNYLCASCDVSILFFGRTQVFYSSASLFGTRIITQTSNISDLYRAVMDFLEIKPEKAIVFDDLFVSKGAQEVNMLPYLYPEILFRKTWAYTKSEFASEKEFKEINTINVVDEPVKFYKGEDIFPLTKAISEKWRGKAKGLAFGDWDAIWSMLGWLCSKKYLCVYGKLVKKDVKDVVVSHYTEEISTATTYAARIAKKLNNPVIVGRQTGDGDMFEWSKKGVCIRIMDPNRPAFPVVTQIHHPWRKDPSGWSGEEPDDVELECYAREGKILATVLWHSGEMAHNEAMAQLIDLSAMTGLKMGIGVHTARYETCPQIWEMLNIDSSRGGVKGQIEPVLHCGGMGVMVEYTAKTGSVGTFCRESLEKIRSIAGESSIPKGHLAFLDSDLATLTKTIPSLFSELEKTGLEYGVSCAMPGRNRILYKKNDFMILNQTVRNICSGSPYVRISNMDDIYEVEKAAPGWMIGVLDAPVVSFLPYIWRRGGLFMEIADWLLSGGPIVNVLPHTIYRYAKILCKMGYIQ